jgi:hypothetical protein
MCNISCRIKNVFSPTRSDVFLICVVLNLIDVDSSNE